MEVLESEINAARLVGKIVVVEVADADFHRVHRAAAHFDRLRCGHEVDGGGRPGHRSATPEQE